MKTCDEVQARLSAYLDGEAGDQEEEIRAHVDTCDACHTILEGLRHVSARVRDVGEAPVGLTEGIRRRVREEGLRRRRSPLVPKLAAAAAIVAALLWGGVILSTADDAVQVSDSSLSGNLSQTERRILYGNPPNEDEWMSIMLTGGRPR